jgi:hypothetical protein
MTKTLLSDCSRPDPPVRRHSDVHPRDREEEKVTGHHVRCYEPERAGFETPALAVHAIARLSGRSPRPPRQLAPFHGQLRYLADER